MESKNYLVSLIDASSLLVSSLEITDILPQAMEIIKNLLACEAASIMLADEKNENLVFEVALGEKGQQLKQVKIPVGKGIAGKSFQTGEPILVEDASKSSDFEHSIDEKIDFKTKSIICVPLKTKDKIVGVAEAINPYKKEHFDEDDMCMLSLFSNQVALAIESARLHKRMILQKRLDDELEFAKTIQQSFLPHEFPEDDNFSIYAITSAARTVGGDFYDVFYLDKERIGFTIGDVSGKGIPAALFMTKVLSQVKALSQKYNNVNDPALVLTELNISLGERRSANMFVTLIYGIFLPKEKKVILSSAAHPYPFVYNHQEKQWKEEETINGLPSGIIKESEYTNKEILFNNGDSLLLLTDGLLETNDSQGNPFMPQVFSKLPAESDKASDVGETIIKELYMFIGDRHPFDDVTLVTIKIK